MGSQRVTHDFHFNLPLVGRRTRFSDLCPKRIGELNMCFRLSLFSQSKLEGRGEDTINRFYVFLNFIRTPLIKIINGT